MTYYKIKDETLTGIADAIRVKKGTSDAYTPTQMATAIGQIETGGGMATRNIAYGNSAPEDTSKLWVKVEAADGVRLTSRPVVAGEELEQGIHALPVATSHMGAASVGTNIYLFGGIAQGYGTDAIHIFDTKTNTISTPNVCMNFSKEGVAAVAVGKKVYLFGGYYSAASHYASDICVFDTENNTFSGVSTSLPKGASRIAAAAVGEKVFLFGGWAEDGYGDWIWVYDTNTNSIYALGAKLPVALMSVTAAAIGTKIYLFGGVSSDGRVDTIYVFDTESYTLSKRNATIPSTVGASYSTGNAIGTKMYLFGGRTMSNTTTDAIAVYDVENDAMEMLDAKLPVVAECLSSAAVGGNIYLFGGACLAGYLPGIHRFATSLPLEQNQLLIEISKTENFAILSGDGNGTIEIGVANVYLGNAEGIAEKVPAAIYQDGAWVEI